MTFTPKIDAPSESSCESEAAFRSKYEGVVKTKRTPLPWVQLLVIYLVQLAEPITATVIYPFINQFIQETGITNGDERKTGYFAGIVQSAFFFAEAVTVVLWGMASDRFGRRPVLLFGPLGLGLVMSGFGMSTQFWPLVFFRCMQGAFNGNIGVTKSVIGEITDSTNIADAYSFVTVFWTSGITIGPFIGGFLAHPATRWPDSLGKIQYLRQHPYFLPCLAASAFAFFAFMTAAVTLKETLHQKYGHSSKTPLVSERDAPHYGSTDNYNHDGCSAPALERGDSSLTCWDESKALSLHDLLKLRDIQNTLINFAFLGFCDMSIQSLTPLMWSTSIEVGGLGFSSYMIGMTMGAFGVANAILQVTFLGKVIAHFGPRNVYMACFSGFFVSLLCFPIASIFAQRAGRCDWRVWLIIIISLSAQSIITSAYAALQIILTGAAPTRSSLGTINGLGQAIGCITKSLGPPIALSLYSISLQHHIAGGNAVYFILLAIVAYGMRFTLLLPKRLRL